MSKNRQSVFSSSTELLDMFSRPRTIFAIRSTEAGAGINNLQGSDVYYSRPDVLQGGVEVIEALRMSGNDVPVLFYKGHGNHDLMLGVAKYGAFEFLEKPNLDGLEEAVARGMKEGFTRKTQGNEAISDDAFRSEFSKLLGK